TVFLLSQALPELARRAGVPSLPDLYAAAAECWLWRDRHDDTTRAALLARLEELVEAAFTRTASPPDARDGLLLQSGLLRASETGEVSFAHYSLLEFFFARVLAR